MELDEIRTLVAVAEAGSVNLAASRLHVSQPAVTRRLQRLESTLGAELLDRDAKPLTLSSAGRLVLERCRQVLKSVEELRASASSKEATGEFRIGLARSVADLALVQPIDQLRKSFPGVILQITTGWSPELLQQVRSGALDVAVIVQLEDARPLADLAGTIVGTLPLAFVSPRRARLFRVVDPHDLADVTWVVNPVGCSFRTVLQRMLQGAGVPFRVAVDVYGFEIQLSLVARGVGFGLVPAWFVRQSRLRSQLRVFRVNGHAFRVAIWAVRGRLGAMLEPVAKALEESLARKLSDVRRSSVASAS